MLSIVIPVYNEEALFEESVSRISHFCDKSGIAFEVIAVSNGSTDKTSEIGERLAAELPWFTFETISKRGVGRAFKGGCQIAKGDTIVSIDLDLPSDMQFLEYAARLEGSYDLLIGSKFMGYQQRSLLRLFGSQLYVILTQFFFGLTVSDYSPDSKAFRKEFIRPILRHLDPWTGYVLEASLYARIQKLRILQVSIDVCDTRPSSFNLFYEGYYRYRHFFRTWIESKRKSSWFHRSFGKPAKLSINGLEAA